MHKNVSFLLTTNYFLIIGTLIIISLAFYCLFIDTDVDFHESFIPCTKQDNPLYSQTVDLGILADTYTCSNFCGPNSTCAITKEQCSSNNDCYGCKPPCTTVPENIEKEDPQPSNFTGKGLEYSTLTSDLGTESSAASPGSLTREVPQTYQGPYEGSWIQNMNDATELFNERLAHEYINRPPSLFVNTPLYNTTESTTGAYYDILPAVNV
jgi:hypothetical protein